MPDIRPMEQFLVKVVVPLKVDIPGLGTVDLSITNSVVTMIAAALIICGFFLMSAKRQIVPGRMQSLSESLYDIIDGVLVEPIIGHNGRPYIPFVFTIFMLVLVMNMMGILLNLGNLFGLRLSFTATAQLAVTATLALLTFLSVIVIGFIKNGFRMYKLFVPSGMSPVLLVFMVPIEMISFFVRPMTLAMRLFGNMIGGHVVMNIFASFVVLLGTFALSGGIAYLGFIGSGVSLAMVVALTALELIVAFLQAFVFATLATVYLNEVVNLGHGH